MANRSNMNMVNDGGSKPNPRVGEGVSNSIRAHGAGTVLGLSGKDLANSWRNDSSRLNLLETAAGSLGRTTETPYSYQDASERNSYLASLKAQLDAQTAAYDQLLAYNQQMYEAQQKQAAQQREDNARRAYIAKEMALKNLPGQLAREGINGGLAETSYVKLNNRYNRSLAEGDSDYSDAVSRAYLDMLNANREPQTGKMNAQASYSAGVAKAPGVKTITGTKVTDTGDIRAFAQAMAKLGYTSEQAADIWNRRYG
jgi:hypothetical protein